MKGYYFSFKVLSLLVVVIMEANISHQNNQLKSMTGYALSNTYTTLPAEIYPDCVVACLKDENCMSLNWLQMDKKCVLNSQKNETRPERFGPHPWSIYFGTFRTPNPEKGMKELPASSCFDVLNSKDSVGTGFYWIDAENTGKPIKIFCDMKMKVVMKNPVVPKKKMTTVMKMVRDG